MKEKFFPFFSYFSYWLKKEDQYSLQSPLLFNLFRDLLKFRLERKKQDLEIENYRKHLIRNQELITVLDLGAGSKRMNTPIRKVAKVTKYSTSDRKYAQLLQYFCARTPAEIVIELGTCVGITTRYLSQVTKVQLLTFEASEALIQVAKTDLHRPNVKFVAGDIGITLPIELKNVEKVNFAFIDANHTYQDTLNSFNELVSKINSNSIIAIGDIHWSSEMQQAWTEIIQRPEVKLSLDFFEIGILLFEFPGKKKHLVLDF